jgi:hypothetical protein
MRQGEDLKACVGFLNEGWIDDAQPLPCRTGDRHRRPGGAPMPPELARTTRRWISLTTPEETLTIAAPERYILRFLDGDRGALRAIAIAALAASSSLSRARSTRGAFGAVARVARRSATTSSRSRLSWGWRVRAGRPCRY